MSESKEQKSQSMYGEEVLMFQQLSEMQKVDLEPFSKSSVWSSSNHMLEALKHHWPEYLMEAAGLGIFMVSAVAFTAILEHPSSPVRQEIADPFLRRMLIGIAMGLTAICIIYSPWGKQSGAHINPSVTLTFFRLGKVKPWDAFFYIIAQFIGGLAGVFLVAAVIRGAITHPSVNYVATIPGMSGVSVAFIAEFIISFILMSMILIVSNALNIARFTGLFAGLMVATYITLEGPFSGMSMNPARTFGSALPARVWTALWVYFTAPPLGMLLAAEVYLRVRGTKSVLCAKLHHQNDKRCIHCGKPEVER
jgi:aquaporin Z